VIKLRAHARAKSCAICLLSIMIGAVFIGAPAFSLLTQNVVIQSTGIIVGSSEVNAASGSAADIQAAVNAVDAVGGGTVNIIGASPAGCMGHEYNWQEYAATTILHNNMLRAPRMFVVDGTNNKPTRISGIRFEATPPTSASQETLSGFGAYAFISLIHANKNFRVDHCDFINNDYSAVHATSYESTYPVAGGYGLIDHCVLDLPFKYENPSVSWIGGYGFVSSGNMWQDRGDDPIKGNWVEDGTVFMGKYESIVDTNILYVEDCKMSSARHAVDGNGGGVVVSRFNLFYNPFPISRSYVVEADAHGTYVASGICSMELMEVYDCTFINDGSDALSYTYYAIYIRNGHSIVHDNTFISKNAGQKSQTFVTILKEGDSPGVFSVDQTYIWNNAGHWNLNYLPIGDNVVQTPAYAYTILLDNEHDSNVVIDRDLFLRAPTQEQDGFTYTPYPYPHPLVAG
jgi:hypothetical protein